METAISAEVGKTSISKSIARALASLLDPLSLACNPTLRSASSTASPWEGFRMRVRSEAIAARHGLKSLNLAQDKALRYVGAMPGKLIQCLKVTQSPDAQLHEMPCHL